MDESGIYRFLECTAIAKGMLNKRGTGTKMKIRRLKCVRGKNTGEKNEGEREQRDE